MVGGWHQLDHHHSRAITRAQIFNKYKYKNIFHVATNIISCYMKSYPGPSIPIPYPYIPPPHRKGGRYPSEGDERYQGRFFTFFSGKKKISKISWKNFFSGKFLPKIFLDKIFLALFRSLFRISLT